MIHKGPIVHLKILGKTIIILNTHEAAVDLLGHCLIICTSIWALTTHTGRRSRIYNGRPRSILINEMMTQGLAFPLVGYNEMYVSASMQHAIFFPDPCHWM